MRLIDADNIKIPPNVPFKASLKRTIEQQPTVQRWIPTSERLPDKAEYLKDDGRFIVTDGNRRYQGLFDIYDRLFKIEKFTWPTKFDVVEDKVVIAWMALPGPYKPD